MDENDEQFQRIEEQLRRPPVKEDKTTLTIGLVEQILALLENSGCTEEEALAALRSARAIVPLMEMQSRHHEIVRT